MSKAERGNPAPREHRRRWVLRTLGLGGATAAGVMGYAGIHHFFETRQKSDDDVIRDYIDHLGMKPDPEEQALWNRANQDIRFTTRPTDASSLRKSTENVLAVLDAMKLSKVDDLATLAHFFWNFHAAQQISAFVDPRVDALVPTRTGSGFDPRINRTIWQIQVSPYHVENTNALTLAIQLLEGLHSAQELTLYENSLVHLPSALDRFREMRKIIDIDSQFTKLNARGFAKKVRAYIHTYALLGGDETIKLPGMKKHAARFIELKADGNAPSWISYWLEYRKETLSKQPTQPTPLRRL